MELAAYSREVAPGSLIAVFGQNFTTAPAAASRLPLPNQLADVQLEVAGDAGTSYAPLIYVSPSQINAQLPYGLTGSAISVRVHNGSGISSADVVPLQTVAPRLLSFSGDGTGDALLFHVNGDAVSDTVPAQPGEVLTLYLTGLGETTPAIEAGAPAGDGQTSPLNRLANDLAVSFGGPAADVAWAGLVPGSAGLYQVNFTAPPTQASTRAAVVVASGTPRSQSGVSAAAKFGVTGNQFYVAPNGRAAATGTESSPWDLATALSQPSAVRPGDTIWLRGGTYGTGATQYVSTLTGSPTQPVILRNYPGERATIDGGFVVSGSDAWYWGFEVMSSLTDRTGSHDSPASGAITGFTVNGPRTKFINLVVHDTMQGFGFWTPAIDAEIYGCIVYHNGWQSDDRGHGHGIYTQNNTGTKHIGDNIVFNQFGLGIQAYGSAQAWVKGYVADHNIVFNNGVISQGAARVHNILFGYGGALERIRVDSNYTYHTPSAASGYSEVGWSFGGRNRDAVVTGNYWIGGYFCIGLWGWDTATYSNNTQYSKTMQTALALTGDQQTGAYVWDNNRYFGFDQFSLNSSSLKWQNWVKQVDAHSTFTTAAPSGTWTFVRPNQYEPGRGNIAIYNWDLKNSVPVDLSRLLKTGAAYEIRDAENFFAPAVVSGTWDGKPVSVPMTGLTVAAPVGAVPSPPQHTAPEFGAFVVLPK